MIKKFLVSALIILFAFILLCGCNEQNTESKNQTPVVSCSANPTNRSPQLYVIFNCSGNDSDGFIVDYIWDFGDGISSSNQNTTHTLYMPGTYKIKLTVVDNDGDSTIKIINITVTQPDEQYPDKEFVIWAESNLVREIKPLFRDINDALQNASKSLNTSELRQVAISGLSEIEGYLDEITRFTLTLSSYEEARVEYVELLMDFRLACYYLERGTAYGMNQDDVGLFISHLELATEHMRHFTSLTESLPGYY
jgi:hypothetical protein